MITFRKLICNYIKYQLTELKLFRIHLARGLFSARNRYELGWEYHRCRIDFFMHKTLKSACTLANI